MTADSKHILPDIVTGWKPIATRVIAIILVGGPFAAMGYALFLASNLYLDWSDLALLLTMYTLTAFGITIGLHRYLTHGSFKTNRLIKITLVILGAMAFEGSPISWVANHRLHHAYSDRDGDPHSPHLTKGLVSGFVYAHIGWFFARRRADPAFWARDLVRDSDILLISRYSLVWALLGLAIPFAIGGWSGLLWGGLVRIFLVHHVTWSVNSVCHIFGSRPFGTDDKSTNFWLVGLLAFGEGGHNTHHAAPKSARHGLYWWHFDLSWMVIRVLQKVRLASAIYELDPTDLKRALRERAASVKVVLRYGIRQRQDEVPV
jgi:stearoyl-CoA desaturase (delta-9 desaturase)